MNAISGFVSLRYSLIQDLSLKRVGAKSMLVSRGMAQLCSNASGSGFDTEVGILGGGQLGQMLCQAASAMGIKVAVLDPSQNCPASSVACRHVRGSFRDRSAVREFAKECGVLTVEIEHVDVDTLDALKSEGVDIQPSPHSIRVIQDKYLQKLHFTEHGIPVPEFLEVNSSESAEHAAKLFGYPLMIKSRRLAYDGRGNAVVRSPDALQPAINSLGGFEHGLYAEKWASFQKELAVMVARGRDGELRCYSVVETTQKDSICHMVEAPADILPSTEKAALDIARKAVGSLEGAGVFGVELFLLTNGEVVLNEVAPRPHNSGHHSIEACYVCQFQQHLRAVLGLPLGDTGLKVPAASMYNVLGEENGIDGFRIAHQLLRKALSVPGASIHWYNKAEMVKQRKMGHITVVGQSRSIVRRHMSEITGFSYPEDSEAAVVGIIMGSDSDLPIMKDAAKVLESFSVPFKMTIVSAHRTTDRMNEFAKTAHEKGYKVIIAGAGGAAHLPGMVASNTPLLVIGVPVNVTALDGMDALLSIVQMPKGVPVATVAIDNATNAALLAVRVLAATDKNLLEKMLKYQEDMGKTVMKKALRLEELGWKNY